jgi:hypothetical protein
MEAERTEKQYKNISFLKRTAQETMATMFTCDGPTETMILVQLNGLYGTSVFET